MMAQSWKPTENFTEPLSFCTTFLFERAAEADLQTVQLRSFSHAKPTRQGRSPHLGRPEYERWRSNPTKHENCYRCDVTELLR